jgi:hypothetical protein
VISLRVTGPAREKYKRTLALVQLVAITGRQATSAGKSKRMTMGGGCVRCPCSPSSPNFGLLGARWRGHVNKTVELFCLPCGQKLLRCTARAVALEGGELP